MPTGTRQRLIEAAWNRFYAQGFRETGLDQILSDVAISKTAFYKHFESKEHLLHTVMTEQSRWLEEHFRSKVEEFGGDHPRAQLLAVFDVVDHITKIDGFRGCFFVNAAMEFPLPHDPAHRLARENKHALHEIVARLAERAGADDPELLARELMLLAEGAYVTRHVTGAGDAAAIARHASEPIIERRLPRTHPVAQSDEEAAEHFARVAATYDAAADHFDDPVNGFWQRTGTRTVERLNLPAGASVLDVACGSGASAVPAAQAVGSGGRVVAVDLSRELVDLAAAKARAHDLENLDLRVANMLDLDPDADQYDAVVCVFGIFFAPDMCAAVRHLWQMVRPGGQLAITSWAAGFLEPAASIFWDAVREVRPELCRDFTPWDEIRTAERLAKLLQTTDAANVEVTFERNLHPLDEPDDWWRMALGSGFRGTIEQLSNSQRQQVHDVCIATLARRGVEELTTHVLYGCAR